MKYQLLYLFFIFMFSCTSQIGSVSGGDERPLRYNEAGFPIGEPGKCYGKSMMNSIFEEETISLHVYTGENKEVDFVEKVSIVIQPIQKEWMKKKSSKPCNSIDPDDCLVWKLVEMPEVVEDFYVVTDTTLKSHYVIQDIVIKKLVKEGGTSEWKEIACNSDITSDLITKVQKSLQSQGYKIPDSEMNIMGKITKKALASFQTENNLPIGNLDFRTLKLLGVK